MKVVADCGNVDYYLLRAIESIQTYREREETGGLHRAIGLLTLAIAGVENANTKTKNKG